MPIPCKNKVPRGSAFGFTNRVSLARNCSSFCERHDSGELQPRQTGGFFGRLSRISGFARLMGCILIFAGLSAPSHALSAAVPPSVSVTLVWAPTTVPGIAGYRLYYGTASRTYNKMVQAGNSTRATVSGLIAGTNYFFAVAAYNTLGLESAYSTELSYRVPSVFVPVVNFLGFLLNGQVVLGAIGEVGHTYQIQASRIVGAWVTIGTVTVVAPGSTEFIDVNGSVLPALTYRIVEVFPAGLTLRRLPSNQVILTVTGKVGRSYSIEASPDLIKWTGIGTVLVPAVGSLDFTDTNAPSFPKRFYRARDTQP